MGPISLKNLVKSGGLEKTKRAPVEDLRYRGVVYRREVQTFCTLYWKFKKLV